MRLVLKNILTISSTVIKVHFKQIRNNATKVLKKEHVTPLNQETLTGRILLYLNIDNTDYKVNLPKENLNIFRDNIKNIQRLNVDQIVNFLSSLSRRRDINKAELSSLITKVDTESCLRLSELDTKNILSLLNNFMNIVPNRVTDCKFYQLAIKELFKSKEILNKDDFLKLIFYIGLQKKNQESQSMLRECMKIIDQNFISALTLEELCIICNSTFKASTKITNLAFLNKVKESIDNNLIILKDPALFITVLKTIRHNRYQDDNLLATVSCGVFFNKTLDCYSFSALCHILALYADYLYYDKNILEIFTKKALKQLQSSGFTSKKSYLLEQPRGKDIKRLLWVLSIFSEFQVVNRGDVEDIIVPKVIDRIKNGEFNGDVNSLIDITLYLWMINYRPKELVPYVLTPSRINQIETKSKSKLRLNLLLYCIYVEDPELYRTLNVRPKKSGYFVSHHFQAKQRPLLEKILDHLVKIGAKFDLGKFEISQEVPFLNVFGITGYKNGSQEKAVFVEILDDYTCVKNTSEDIPGGMMALKLRLLDTRQQGVLVVSQREIEEMTESEISEYLIDELKLIC